MGRGGLVQVAEIDRIAGSSLLSDSSHDGDQQVLIYQRTSPQSRVKNVDGLPEHQLAMSVSFLNLSERLSKMRDRAIIYEENLPRQTRTRPGMIRLIARILSGEVSDVIITCPNRVSSDEFALFFEAVCTRMNTKIHCAANVGLKYSDVVKRDMQRLESNRCALRTYTESNNELANLVEGREHYNEIQNIKAESRKSSGDRDAYWDAKFNELEVWIGERKVRIVCIVHDRLSLCYIAMVLTHFLF